MALRYQLSAISLTSPGQSSETPVIIGLDRIFQLGIALQNGSEKTRRVPRLD